MASRIYDIKCKCGRSSRVYGAGWHVLIRADAKGNPGHPKYNNDVRWVASCPGCDDTRTPTMHR